MSEDLILRRELCQEAAEKFAVGLIDEARASGRLDVPAEIDNDDVEAVKKYIEDFLYDGDIPSATEEDVSDFIEHVECDIEEDNLYTPVIEAMKEDGFAFAQ